MPGKDDELTQRLSAAEARADNSQAGVRPDVAAEASQESRISAELRAAIQAVLEEYDVEILGEALSARFERKFLVGLLFRVSLPERPDDSKEKAVGTCAIKVYPAEDGNVVELNLAVDIGSQRKMQTGLRGQAINVLGKFKKGVVVTVETSQGTESTEKAVRELLAQYNKQVDKKVFSPPKISYGTRFKNLLGGNRDK